MTKDGLTASVVSGKDLKEWVDIDRGREKERKF